MKAEHETGLQACDCSAQTEELKQRGEEWLKRHGQEGAEYLAEHF